jgi:hypothetical protein
MNSNDSKPPQITTKERKDLKVLALFTSVYCQSHHQTDRQGLADLPDSLAELQRYQCCGDCVEFLHYAIERRLKCPLDPKPSCKHCELHCYRPGHREKVREIMRYSGRALIRRGRLDLLWHYLF